MLVQLSGVPGSGKSTLARSLARSLAPRLPLVVLDTDVVKSALLHSGVPVAAAGRATYTSVLALAADLLAQGSSVVIDSPCRYRALLEQGQQVAAGAGAAYAFLELRTPDVTTLLDRLDRRAPHPSQVASSTEPAPGTTWEHGTGEATLRAWQDQLVRPAEGWLALDATAAPDVNAGLARDHLVALVGGNLRPTGPT